jgi:hypothetical protein
VKRPHALEIALTRPASNAEASALGSQVPGRYAFSGDLSRVAAVIAATTAAHALEQAWTQTADSALLPVDAIWSLYPDAEGFVQLTIGLDDAIELELRRRAEHRGQNLDDFVTDLLREAAEHETAQRLARIQEAVDRIRKQYSDEEVLRALLTAPAPDTG